MEKFKKLTEKLDSFLKMGIPYILLCKVGYLCCYTAIFPATTALLKTLYLTTYEATKNWTILFRNWDKIYDKQTFAGSVSRV